jgi:hypothetical protein
VIGPNGPDHDTYRVGSPSAFELTVENLTGHLWRIDLEGFDIGGGDCRSAAADDMALVAYVTPGRTSQPRLATPPDYCTVPPHSVIKVVKPQRLGGSALVSVTRLSSGARYPVILEFGP